MRAPRLCTASVRLSVEMGVTDIVLPFGELRITNYDGTAKTPRAPSNRQVIYCCFN